MHYAPLPGLRLRYQMNGVRGAPVLVLSNSLGTDLAMWEPQMQALGAMFCVVRYDTRGHGESGVTPGPYTIEQLGRDVVGLLDHLEVPRASFCGLSMGGMIGMWLGIHAPERIERLVLANTAARIGSPDIWNARIEKVTAGGMAAISEMLLARWFTPAFIASEPAAIARMKAMLERQPPAGYVASCAAVRDMDQRDAVAAIPVPTLVIAGMHDAVTPPAEGKILAAQIRGATLVEVPAAHLSNIEAPPAFTAALTDFLKH